MKYKCLIMDHDDTVVKSTESIHYPAFLDTLKKLRPGVHLSLEEFFSYNFDPGFVSLCRDILSFNDEEMEYQYVNWQNHVKGKMPEIYGGMGDFLWKFKNQGGKIFVSSHSDSESIIKQYKYHGLPEIERVYGWELGNDKIKPNTYTVDSIIGEYGFEKESIAMVDDLKPGKIMADKSGIDFLAVGWSHDIREIKEYFKNTNTKYFKTIGDLDSYIFKD